MPETGELFVMSRRGLVLISPDGSKVWGWSQASGKLMTDDLQTHGLLDKTLIVVATEFGRPAGWDGGGGRGGHHGGSFSYGSSPAAD